MRRYLFRFKSTQPLLFASLSMRSCPPERAAGGGSHFGWPFGNVLPEVGALFVGLVVPVVAVVLCASAGSTPLARNSAASAIRVVCCASVGFRYNKEPRRVVLDGYSLNGCAGGSGATHEATVAVR